MTPDDYLQQQIMPMLQPGEQVLHSAYMRRQPGILMQILFVGGLLLYMITKAYFVVLTNRRMILIRTKMSAWSGGPKLLNLGVEQWDARNLKNCTTSGFANNRSMTFYLHQGAPQTLRISPWGKKIQGTATFLEQVPALIASGQLAQQQLPQPQGQPLPQGARVTVAGPDGNRYPGTIMQASNGQYLLQMPDGQTYWYPAHSVQA